MANSSIFSNVGALLPSRRSSAKTDAKPAAAKNWMSHFKVVEFDHFRSETALPSGQKETPAPVNREGLRKKFPGSTSEIKTTNDRYCND